MIQIMDRTSTMDGARARPCVLPLMPNQENKHLNTQEKTKTAFILNCRFSLMFPLNKIMCFVYLCISSGFYVHAKILGKNENCDGLNENVPLRFMYWHA